MTSRKFEPKLTTLCHTCVSSLMNDHIQGGMIRQKTAEFFDKKRPNFFNKIFISEKIVQKTKILLVFSEISLVLGVITLLPGLSWFLNKRTG